MLVTNFMVIAIQFVNILQINGVIKTFPRLIKHEGDTAVLSCFSTLPIPENPIQWKHRAIGPKIQDFSNVYFLNGLSEAYAKDGRHRILNGSLKSLDLEITGLVSLKDAGTYRCAYEKMSSGNPSDTELIIIESHRCTSNVSLDNVLIDNDCGLSPDFIGLTCMLRYRGNVQPVLNWSNSTKPNSIISTSKNQPQSNDVTSVDLSLKPEFHLNGIYYICSIGNMTSQISVCQTEDIKVAYIFKPSAVFNSDPNDIATITCISNTSSQECGYRWHGHNLSSNVGFQSYLYKLQLDEYMNNLSCVSQCKIRRSWCAVSSVIYSNIPDHLQKRKSADRLQEPGKSDQSCDSGCQERQSMYIVGIVVSIFICIFIICFVTCLLKKRYSCQCQVNPKKPDCARGRGGQDQNNSTQMRTPMLPATTTLIIYFFGMLHLIGAEIKTYPKELIKLQGDSVILHCVASSNPPSLLQWRHWKFDSSAQHTEDVIFNGKYMMELFNKGRHSVTLKESPQTCNLNITGITMDDAGTYICGNINSTEHSDIELIVLESQPRCGSNISLENILVENDCNLTPDYIDLTCSVGYRGKIAPVLHLLHSGKPEIVIATSVSQPQSSGITGLNHPIKPTYDMNGTYFICSFELGTQERECTTKTIVIDYIFRPNAIKTSSSADSLLCIANTSSNQCDYQWHGTGVPSNKTGQRIQLDKTINNVSCTTECEIRGNKCVVISHVFTQVFPEINVDNDNASSKIHIPAIIVPILACLLCLLIVIIIVLLWKFKFKRGRRMKQYHGDCLWEDCVPLSAIVEQDIKYQISQQNYDNIELKNCSSSDIIQGFKEVKRKGKKLEDYIDPENGLLTALGNRGVINDSEIYHLQKLKPYQKLNEELLRKISLKINLNSMQFIEALCEDEQEHIAKFIVTAGCETDSDERLLPRDLRKVIDDNMFCLEKLMDTEKKDLELKLVTANCITSRHQERVIHSKQEDKAYELLIILQRRRYKDFFSFMECLRKTMQNNIVKILGKGGVTEVKIEVLNECGDQKNIEAELIKELMGYVDEDNESELNDAQKKLVEEIFAELKEKGIDFIGMCSGTSKGSFSMFLQGEKDDSLQVLNDGCESGSLKVALEKLFRSVLKIPGSWPSLVKDVTVGQHSNKHHVTTEAQQNSEGKRLRITKDSNEKWKITTMKWYATIVANFDPKEHVVNTLYKEGILTCNHHKDILDVPDAETRAENLLLVLFESGHPQAFVVFIEALMKDYAWIVKMIDDPQEDIQLTTMADSNEEWKIKTKKCFSKIVSSLDPKGHVLNTLLEKGVLTCHQYREVRDGPDAETRAVNLLSILFKSNHPQAFVVFRKALQKDYAWIVDMIDHFEKDIQLTTMADSNEELKIKTRKFYSKIVSCLDPKGHVLNTLFEKEIITYCQYREIQDFPDAETRAGRLLFVLFESIHPVAFVVFIEALKKDYAWIVDMIDHLEDDTKATTLTNTNDELKRKIMDCYSRIVSSVDPIGHIVNILFEKAVIPGNTLEKVNSGPDPGTRAKIVLSYLSVTAHPQAFVVFREALKKDYGFIIQMIDEYNDQNHSKESLYPVAPMTVAPSESVLPRNQSTEDIEKFILGYQSVTKQLSQYMDPENGLLLSLLYRGVITETFYNKVNRVMPYKQLNEDLLKVLTPKIETCCMQLKDALIEDDQEHIVKFILTSGTNNDDDRVLRKEEIDVINNNMFGLVHLINPNRMSFLYRLLQYRCITDTHKERVASCQTTDKKVDELLIILKRRRYVDFCNFKKCLKDTMQNKIVDILDRCGLIAASFLREREDREIIESTIIDRLTGYVNERKDPIEQLSADQIKVTNDILKEMENSEWSIRTIGPAP